MEETNIHIESSTNTANVSAEEKIGNVKLTANKDESSGNECRDVTKVVTKDREMEITDFAVGVYNCTEFTALIFYF